MESINSIKMTQVLNDDQDVLLNWIIDTIGDRDRENDRIYARDIPNHIYTNTINYNIITNTNINTNTNTNIYTNDDDFIPFRQHTPFNARGSPIMDPTSVIDAPGFSPLILSPRINYTNIKQNINIICQQLEITDEDQDCCICMETREKFEICSLNCGHKFCATCIESCIKKPTNYTCSLCRQNVTVITANINDIKEKLEQYCN